MPVVPLPSGALAPLETPGLVPLVSGGGGVLDVARATLAHDEVDAESLTTADAFAVALWGLMHFCDSDEAVSLISVCAAFGDVPSRRLGLADAVLAWRFDSACAGVLAELRAQAMAAMQERPEAEEPRPGVITYSVPDTWTGDDDE